MKITIKNFPLLILDAVSFYLALFLSLAVRTGGVKIDAFYFHLKPFAFPLLFLILTFFALGLYDLKNLSGLFTHSKLLITGVGVFFIIATLYFYFFPFESIAPKTILVIFSVMFGLVNFGIRETFRRYMIRSQPIIRLLLIAKGRDVEELVNYIEENPQLGYRVSKWIKEYNIKEIDQAMADNENPLIVIPSQMRGDQFFGEKIYEKILEGKEVVMFSDFYESIFGKVSLDELKENWFLDKVKPKDGLYGFFKRVVDVILAGLVIILSIAFWPIIALLIKFSSAGPTFFVKERIGLGERRFRLYKFRTMHSGRDEKNEVRENFSEERGDGRRVFMLGKIMRKVRLDEVPQAINVLKGELSFVGPRADFVDYYLLLKEKIPYYQIRTVVTPGLSGWAQIHNKTGDSIENARERLAYDIYYIKNRSLILDLAVSLKTLKTILTFSGG